MDSVDVSIGAVIVLGGLVLLRCILVAVGVTLLLRPVRECPACFEPTVRVRRPILEALIRIVEWRWCLSCGWQGPARAGDRDSWTRKNATSRV